MNAQGPEWRVVLVRPRNPLNIGAAARAMANFGFSDLAVVEPHPPVWREARSAVGAADVLQGARLATTIQEAVGDSTLVMGTTSGQRRTLDRELLSLHDLAAWLRANAGNQRHERAAILFGSEKTGLSNENLSYCHALLRIPTRAHCPSMNLGQAVAVCCYEIARACGATGDGEGETCAQAAAAAAAVAVHLSPPANLQSLDHLFERAARVLDAVGYLKPKSRGATLVKLRRALIDRRLSNNDAKILGGVLAQIEWKLVQP